MPKIDQSRFDENLLQLRNINVNFYEKHDRFFSSFHCDLYYSDVYVGLAHSSSHEETDVAITLNSEFKQLQFKMLSFVYLQEHIVGPDGAIHCVEHGIEYVIETKICAWVRESLADPE